MDVGRPGTPGSDKIFTAVDVATEDVYVGIWIGLWDANEGDKTVPRSDTAVEIVMLPGLAVVGECLSDVVSTMLEVAEPMNEPLQ